jgi:Protein of unknown function (DUF3261)
VAFGYFCVDSCGDCSGIGKKMKRFWMRLNVLFIVLVLCACSTFKPTLQGRSMYVTDQLTYVLQDYHLFSLEPKTWQQEIVITSPNGVQTLITSVEVSQQGLIWVFMTPFGQNLLTIRDDGRHVVSEGVLVKQLPIDPAWLLALLQISMWDVGQVNAGFMGYGNRFELSDVALVRANAPWVSQRRVLSYQRKPEIEFLCCDVDNYASISLPKQKTMLKIRVLNDVTTE